MRADVEVVTVEPEELADEVARLNPALVIYSTPTARTFFRRQVSWVEFCPYEEPAARICVDGHYAELEKVRLDDLLEVVDQTEKVLQRES